MTLLITAVRTRAITYNYPSVRNPAFSQAGRRQRPFFQKRRAHHRRVLVAVLPLFEGGQLLRLIHGQRIPARGPRPVEARSPGNPVPGAGANCVGLPRDFAKGVVGKQVGRQIGT